MGFLDAPINPASATALAGKVAKSELVANAADYGAKGDGTTDDTTAIQSAITAAITKGITAYIGPGTYKLTAPLRTTGDGLTLRLANGANILRYHNNNMFINGAAGTTTNGHSNIEISGGTWDLRGVQIADFGSVFSVGKASNIRIHDTALKNNCMSHMVEMAGVSNVVIERVRFGGYIDPVGNRNYAEAFQLERISSVGFPSFAIDDLTPCTNITVRNCTQTAPDAGYSNWPVGVGTHTTDTGGVLNSNVRIMDNNFGTCTYRGVRIGNWVNVQVERNIMTNPSGYGMTITGDGTTENKIRVRDNTITSSTTSAIDIHNTVGLSVAGNSIVGQTNGIAVSGSTSVIIGPSNTITATTFDGVVILNSGGDTIAQSNIHIKDNVFPAARLGVNISDSASKVLITGNNFRSLTNHGVGLNGTSGQCIVEGNRFTLPTGNRVVNFIAGSGTCGIAGNMYPAATTTFQNGTAAQAFTGTNFPIL